MPKHSNDNIDRISQELGQMLSVDWDRCPLTSRQFVKITAHLIEIANRSGMRADYVSELLCEAIQEAQKLADRKLIL